MTVTIVENGIDGLDKILKDNKKHEFGIMLGSGDVYSRKTIKLQKNGNYKITNHIDNTSQTLTKDEIKNKAFSNIGEALEKRALFIMPK